MTKSNWTPDSAEPGRAMADWLPSRFGPGKVPLTNFIYAGLLIAFGLFCASILLWPGVIGNLGATCTAAGAALIAFGGSVYPLRLGVLRVRWRKTNISQTGGRYLRAWQSWPPKPSRAEINAHVVKD
jgi:hypothetical protein